MLNVSKNTVPKSAYAIEHADISTSYRGRPLFQPGYSESILFIEIFNS